MDIEYLLSAKNEIRRWESEGPGFLGKVSGLVLRPAENAARTIVPAGVRKGVAQAVQTLLTGLTSATDVLCNRETVHQEIALAQERHGDALKAADVVAKRYRNLGLAYAVGEGGATGALGLAGLVADVPALLTLSLRLIRQVGTCYGYDATSDAEREYLLHVLSVGSTANIQTKMEFLAGLKRLEEVLLKVSWMEMSETLARKEIGRFSIFATIRHVAERLGIQLTERKALQIVPVVGALVGASFNAMLVSDVGRAAYMLYRRRRIAEFEGPSTTVVDVTPHG